jgi:hypothetical protein
MHSRPTSRSPGRSLLWVAAAAGAIHAGFSLYWAVGGSWLLDTVGQEAVRLQQEYPLGAAALLLAVSAGKVAAATLPVIAQRKPGTRLRRVVRLVSWIGGGCLLAYGSVYAIVSAAVLAGLITASGPIDRRGLIGHAVLWDPLFAVRGAALLAGLWLTRTPPEPPGTRDLAEEPGARYNAEPGQIRSATIIRYWNEPSR